MTVYAPSTAHSGGGDGDGGDGGGGVWLSTLAIPLKLRRIISPRMLQGAPPGCDSPRMLPSAPCIPSRTVLRSRARNNQVDRAARPAVVKKTPIESRKPTIVQLSVKQICASVMPTMMKMRECLAQYGLRILIPFQAVGNVLFLL